MSDFEDQLDLIIIIVVRKLRINDTMLLNNFRII